MTIATGSSNLGTLVAGNPAYARVLDRFGLDYCCHGDRPLDAACADAGIDADVVGAALSSVIEEGDAAWAELDLEGLVEHLISTHHAYLHEELPAVAALAEKVRQVHRARHAELDEVAALVDALREDLEPHLAKEERILFPAIRALVAGQRSFPFGTVANSIRVMAAEHDRAGELLTRLRAATGGYTVPADGCASYAALYQRLEALELDTHLHVLKENHTLFPSALALTET